MNKSVINSHVRTESEGLVAIVQILSIDSNHRKLQLLSELHSVVTVLKFLHVASHCLEWLLVHLVPVDNARLDLVKQLQGRQMGILTDDA